MKRRRGNRPRHRRQPRARRRHRPGARRRRRQGLRRRPRHHDHHQPRRHPRPARRDQLRTTSPTPPAPAATCRSSSTTPASVAAPASLAPAAVDAARAELETNYFGSLRMAQAFAPVLRDNGGGALVNVLSVLSFVSMPQAATYSASKAAAWSLTNALRMELRQPGDPRGRRARRVHRHRHGRRHRRREGQPSVGRHPDRRRHRSRRRGGARRPDQRAGEGRAGRRPHHAVPRPAGAVGREVVGR